MESKMERTITKEEILEKLKQVFDPELGVNIVDLGLIYAIEWCEGHLTIRMTLTTPGCPMHDTIVGGVHRVLEGTPTINDLKVDVVWEPQWSPELMSDAAKEQMDFF
jgi:metal-sulfur cluster biosynthetic enzyme